MSKQTLTYKTLEFEARMLEMALERKALEPYEDDDKEPIDE
jgi:hypothetical protein